MYCVNILFLANLRPKESRHANSRLFFGVEQETRTEKSKSAFNLKVACIAPFYNKKTMLIQNSCSSFLLRPIHTWFLLRRFFVFLCYRSDLCII